MRVFNSRKRGKSGVVIDGDAEDDYIKSNQTSIICQNFFLFWGGGSDYTCMEV